jgi:uncharacterized protein (DUF2147 family)
MQFVQRCFPVVVLSACLAGQVIAAAPAEPTGEWLVADGTARVRITPCGDALWGVIAWTKSAPGRDENNPDPAKRKRSVLGMPILLNMKRAASNRWDGEVYNAKDGSTYSSHISLVRADVLRIDGCVLGGLFCGGENWTRVPPEQTTSSAPAPAPANKPKGVCP